MTCEQALVQLLEADADELDGRGSSDLAIHMQSCDRCRAVATTLQHDTQRLANAYASGTQVHVAERRVRRMRSMTLFVPVTALAAGVVLMLSRGTPETPRVPAVVTVAHVDTPAVAPLAPVHVAERTVARAPQSRRLPDAVAAVAVAVQPVAIVPAKHEIETEIPDVQVDPEPGVRATVMRGRSPNVTVVWFSK